MYAVLRLHVVDHLLTDLQGAARDGLEPGDHAQCGRLATARRTNEHEELLVGDLEIQVVDRVIAVLVDLVDAFELDGCHVDFLL